ncbi:hypothetical protein FUT87_03470 [Mitsuaria sp. TWR114]|uniref:hypothetical protein n=1 Tax=Mitsuaria sp. TWR114 TaxID=2601731 RepID=UPI0011BE9ECA|nr:hypothetical protein [Mitsuaria sp. TWR114]TXD74595.1 hypothetical protein FUT87_23660 [Mitsuaria sp. TWR114]TXD99258.1 hypothetical protein FUT87_03470 [Mitsuaria sp. TWR114]
MRSALSILAVVIVLSIIMLTAKKQMETMKPRPPAASAASSGAAAPSDLPQPEAVGRQVQDLMKQGEQRASEADAR